MIHDRRMVQVTPSQTSSASVSLRLLGCIFALLPKSHFANDGIQTRKKACRIGAENGAPFQIIQLGAFQDPLFGVYGQVPAQVRKICTKQNLIDPHYVAQHAKHGIACSKRRIPIDPTEHISSRTSFLAACNEPHLIDDRKTRGKERDRASSVREDVLHIWCACEPVGVMHLSDCTIGIGREVNQIVG